MRRVLLLAALSLCLLAGCPDDDDPKPPPPEPTEALPQIRVLIAGQWHALEAYAWWATVFPDGTVWLCRKCRTYGHEFYPRDDLYGVTELQQTGGASYVWPRCFPRTDVCNTATGVPTSGAWRTVWRATDHPP